MSTLGLSFVGKFVLFWSVLYRRFHCIIMQPFHVSIYATLSPEVSLRVIKEKVGSASGSKSNIKT